MYLSHETNTIYQGGRVNWKDIELTNSRPSEYHSPIIENGQHKGKWQLNQEAFMEAKEAELDAAIQQRLDAFAFTRKYADMDRLCTYVTSTDSQFAAEAARGVQLRDDTWKAAGVILNDVLAGNRPVPESLADIEAELPELTWGDL